jgi:hypothetical protein
MATVISQILKEKSVKYISGDIIISDKDQKQTIQFDEFLKDPSKYLPFHDIQIYFLLLKFIETNDLKNIKKIIDNNIIGSEYYDSAIDAVLSNNILAPTESSMDIIKLLYENISLERREYFMINCIANTKNPIIVNWIIDTLKNEPYLEITNILEKVPTMDQSLFHKLIEYYTFDEIKELLFLIMFQNSDNAKLYLETYKKKTGKNNLLDIPSQKVVPVVISKILSEGNKEIGQLLFNNLELDKDDSYLWLIFALSQLKFEMLNFIFEYSNIKKIDAATIQNCLVISNDIKLETLAYLNNNKDKFENLDLTCKNHHIMRNAIMNDNSVIVSFLLENDIYPVKSMLEDDELLNDTVTFFASDSINEIIDKFYKNKE